MTETKNTYGGGKATKTGALFEDRVSLREKLLSVNFAVNECKVSIKNEEIGFLVSKHAFYSTFLEKEGIDYKEVIARRLLPDEAFVNVRTKTVYIFEIKYQQSHGSVDEKLQTCGFKKWQYEKLLQPIGYKLEFIFILNDWFKAESYEDVLDYIKKEECLYFFNEIPIEILNIHKTVE